MRQAKIWSIVVAAGMVAGVALAQGPRQGEHERFGPGPKGPGMGHGVFERLLEHPEVMEKIGLTEEQKEILTNEGYELRKAGVQLHADMELAAMEQARLLMADEVDEDAVMAAVEKTGRIRTEGAKLRMKMLLLVKNTLTEEQQTALQKMARRHMKRRQMRREHGEEGRGGERGRPDKGRRDPHGERARGPERPMDDDE